MLRDLFITGIVAVSFSAAADAPAPREPYAKAHVSMVARSESGHGVARLAEIDVWAEGTRLRARVRGEPDAGELWIDGLAAEPLRLVDGKVVEPPKRSLEAGLKLALSAAPSLAAGSSDRVAGHPCKVVSEQLPAGVSLTRCFWRGLPLSVELKSHGFTFNAAATLIEEGAVTVADLQAPPGAPAAPTSLSAGR